MMARSTIRGIAIGFLLAGILTLLFHQPNSQEKKFTLAELKKASHEYGFELVKETVPKVSKDPEKLPLKKNENPNSAAESKGSAPFTLQITKGMTSESIGTTLKQAGILQDSAAFIHYLESNGLSSRIQIGSFILTKEMTQIQIANTITK
ncbi:hypothetical protein [Bacillus sp. 1P06AnD]|uniref:hypothetical protein n=1 Tax=Bacillus sp. 1P06AnD TaxID=3132208 RepID=UPI00399FEFB1